MKKILLAVLMAFSFAQTTFAASDKFFNLGAGIYSNVFVPFGEEDLDMVGESYGVDLQFQFWFGSLVSLNPSFGMDIGIASGAIEGEEAKIGHITVSSDDEDIDGTFLNITFPILARFNFGNAFAEFGPQFNFNILNAFSTTHDSDSEILEDAYNGTEFALTFGGGYRLWFGLEFEGRFSLGLTDLIDEPKYAENINIKKMSFNLYISYWFIH